jgi:hypothetical protein
MILMPGCNLFTFLAELRIVAGACESTIFFDKNLLIVELVFNG